MNTLVANIILASGAGGAGGDSGSKGLSQFFGALTESVQGYVRIIIMLIGIVMVGFGVYQIAKNLISHGKAQTNWFVTIALIVFGGIFMLSSGFSVLRSFTDATKSTVSDLSQGTADTNKKPGDLNDGVKGD